MTRRSDPDLLDPSSADPPPDPGLHRLSGAFNCPRWRARPRYPISAIVHDTRAAGIVDPPGEYDQAAGSIPFSESLRGDEPAHHDPTADRAPVRDRHADLRRVQRDRDAIRSEHEEAEAVAREIGRPRLRRRFVSGPKLAASTGPGRPDSGPDVPAGESRASNGLLATLEAVEGADARPTAQLRLRWMRSNALGVGARPLAGHQNTDLPALSQSSAPPCPGRGARGRPAGPLGR
jgi:hypothetical protein